MDFSRDIRVIVCNHVSGSKVFRPGAKCYVNLCNPGNGGERILVSGVSRGGRIVKRWEPISRLGNFRFKTMPPEHPLYLHLGHSNSDWELDMLNRAKLDADSEYISVQVALPLPGIHVRIYHCPVLEPAHECDGWIGLASSPGNERVPVWITKCKPGEVTHSVSHWKPLPGQN